MRMVVFVAMASAYGFCLVIKGRELLRDPRNVFLRSLVLTVTVTLLAAVIISPPVMTFLEISTGIPVVWGTASTAAAVTAARSMLLLWTHGLPSARRQIRLGWAAYAVAMSAVLVLSVLVRGKWSPTEVMANRDAPEVYAATVPYARDALLIFALFLALSYGDITVRLFRTVPVADRRWLRLGLWIIFISASLLCVSAVALAAYALTYRLGVELMLLQPLSVAVTGIGSVGATIGFVVPQLGPRLDRMLAYRRLRYMWAEFGVAAPGVILHTPRLPVLDGWNPWRSDFRLYRRVIEIRDGIQALRPYFRDDVGAAAHSLGQAANQPEHEIETTVTAAQLRAALHDKSSGITPHDRSPIGRGQLPDASLDAEVKVLVSLARAFQHSPIVRAAVATADRAHGVGAG